MDNKVDERHNVEAIVDEHNEGVATERGGTRNHAPTSICRVQS